jgi:RNA polymerase sigma factor (sigma-70 family)
LVFDAHAAAVMAFLAGAVGSAEAEDCFQETMLSALRAYPRLGDASNLRGWLFTIARRKAIDAHRARARRPAPVADPDPGATLDEHAQVDDGLWDQVRSLPLKQRKAVVLRFAGDRSYPEIAAAMSTTQDSARQSVHEGLKKLRKELR